MGLNVPVMAATKTTVPVPQSAPRPEVLSPLAAPYASVVDALEKKLASYAASNDVVGGFYDQEYRTKLLDLGLPKEAAQLRLVMGWARTIVDVLAERIEPVTWDHADMGAETAAALWEDSGAVSSVPQAITDMLIYGTGFISATAGDPAKGEPRVLIRAHSATNTTAVIDDRTGWITQAITVHDVQHATLWLPQAVVDLVRSGAGASWSIASASPNPLGVVPMVATPNAPRAGLPGGRSEITPAMRSYIGSATRAIISMDVNREFFSIPHRYLIGVAGNMRGPDGQVLEAWQLAARAMLKIPYSEEGGDVQVGEFSQVSAGPFLEQVQGLAKSAAAEAAIPSMYLGVESAANPSSADAIRMTESRLVRRSRRRIGGLKPQLARLGQIAWAIHAGTPLDVAPRPTMVFADPATSAFSADADAWVKLIQAGAAPANSPALWRRMGFTEDEIAENQAALSRGQSTDRLKALSDALSARYSTPAGDPGPAGEE